MANKTEPITPPENTLESRAVPEPKIISPQGFESDANLEWQDVNPGVILVSHNPAFVLLARWKGEATYTFKAFRPNGEGKLEDLVKSAKDFDGLISLPRSIEYLSATGYNQIAFSPNSSIQIAFIGGFNASQR